RIMAVPIRVGATIEPGTPAELFQIRTVGNPFAVARRQFQPTVDAAGNAYVAGHTVGHSNWGDFPTVKPLQSPGSGGAFVTKFDPAGAMVYSMTLGGSGRSDWATAIAVDSLGDMYVSGSTSATDFPTSHPLQATLKGGTDAFVTV